MIPHYTFLGCRYLSFQPVLWSVMIFEVCFSLLANFQLLMKVSTPFNKQCQVYRSLMCLFDLFIFLFSLLWTQVRILRNSSFSDIQVWFWQIFQSIFGDDESYHFQNWKEDFCQYSMYLGAWVDIGSCIEKQTLYHLLCMGYIEWGQ